MSDGAKTKIKEKIEDKKMFKGEKNPKGEI